MHGRSVALGGAVALASVVLAALWRALAPSESVLAAERGTSAETAREDDAVRARAAGGVRDPALAARSGDALAAEAAPGADAIPRIVAASAPRPLAARVESAVRELADDLRASRFDLAGWDCAARAHARRLGAGARDVLHAWTDRADATLEERVAAAELALALATPASPARLSPAAEAALFAAVLAHASEPRLAAAAARPHAQLGGAAALEFWIGAASADQDGLGALALRALGGVRGAAAIDALSGALEACTDDEGRARLAIVLGTSARAGAAAWLEAASRERAIDALSALGDDVNASASTRQRARSALASWRGEDAESGRPSDAHEHTSAGHALAPGCDSTRAPAPVVASADPRGIERALRDAGDLARSSAERRRDVAVLAHGDVRAASELARILLHDPAAEVRSAAAAALARADVDAAKPALEHAAATDPSAAVRRQAESALARR